MTFTRKPTTVTGQIIAGTPPARQVLLVAPFFSLSKLHEDGGGKQPHRQSHCSPFMQRLIESLSQFSSIHIAGKYNHVYKHHAICFSVSVSFGAETCIRLWLGGTVPAQTRTTPGGGWLWIGRLPLSQCTLIWSGPMAALELGG